MFDKKQEEKKRLLKKYNRSLLSKREASYELLFSIRTLDRMRREGEIQEKEHRGKVVFHVDEIARIICEEV